MSVPDLAGLLRYVRRLHSDRPNKLADGTLLGRFVRQADEAAFATLVRRHGPLVWSVSRRVARHEQDAEDVYQATFLLLARKAGAICKRNSVGSWLYGVAHRLALRARCDAARRRQHEGQAAGAAAATVCDNLTWRELRETLDVELALLPEKYRAPLLLCYFEGLTQEEAARQLGWSKRSVKDRLERGRNRLRARLARGGMTLSMTLAGSLINGDTGKAAAPAALSEMTLRTAMALAQHKPLAGLVSSSVLQLAERGLKTMFVSKLLIAVTCVLGAAALASAGLLLGHGGPEAKPEQAAPVSSVEKSHFDLYGDPLPPGALARLGTVRYRFDCSGLAFLPGSETVVSVYSGGGPIQFWEARNGQLLREIDTGPFSIGWAFALSGDGRRLAVGGALTDATKPGYRSAARVYDTQSGKEVRTFERQPRDGVHSLALNPDGRLLLSLGGNGKLRMEEVATGVELLEHQFPGDVSACLALSCDGSSLAVASGPNTRKLYVWKWQTAEEPRELNAPGYRDRNIRFSPDGKLLAACSDDDAAVHVWEVQGSRLLHKLELPYHEAYRHFDVAFSPDGKMVAASGSKNYSGAVHLWDSLTGKFLQRLDIGSGRLAFSPNSRLLVAGSRVWDFVTSKELSANEQAPRGQIERIVTAGNMVVTANGDNTIRIWDAASGKQERQLVHDGWIRDIALSPDGKMLVSSSLDDTVCLWDIASGQKIFRLPGHGRLGGRRAVAFTLDGKYFLSWGDDMDLRKWDVRTGKAVSEDAIRPTGIRVFGEDDEPMERDKLGGSLDGLLSQDGKHLILHSPGKVFVFDALSGNELRHFPMEGGLLIAQAVSPDGKLLLTSAWGKPIQTKLPDGAIQSTTPMSHPVSLWELETGRPRIQLTLPERGAGPVAFSADGRLFAAASSRPGAHIRVWNALGHEVHVIEGFSGVVRSLAFMPDGKRLVSGMDNSSALIWDLTQQRSRTR